MTQIICLNAYLAAARALPQFVGGKAVGLAGTGANINSNVGLTDLTGGLNTAPQEGDLVVVGFTLGSATGSDSNLVVSSGYTEAAETFANDDNESNLVVAYKFMGSTPDTQVTVNPGSMGHSANAMAVAVHVWRGVDPTTPLDVAAVPVSGTNTSLPNPAAITPVTTGAIIIACGAGSTNATAFNAPSDLTNFVTVGQADTVNSHIGMGSVVWAGGSFNPEAWTGGSTFATHSWTAITLALRPA